MVITFKKGTWKQFQERLKPLPTVKTQIVSSLKLFGSKLATSLKKKVLYL